MSSEGLPAATAKVGGGTETAGHPEKNPHTAASPAMGAEFFDADEHIDSPPALPNVKESTPVEVNNRGWSCRRFLTSFIL